MFVHDWKTLKDTDYQGCGADWCCLRFLETYMVDKRIPVFKSHWRVAGCGCGCWASFLCGASAYLQMKDCVN